MGLFELFMAYVHIPSMLVLLILLSTNKMRRQINWVVTHFCNFHFNLNGNKVKILPFLSVINMFYLYISMTGI